MYVGMEREWTGNCLGGAFQVPNALQNEFLYPAMTLKVSGCFGSEVESDSIFRLVGVFVVALR